MIIERLLEKSGTDTAVRVREFVHRPMSDNIDLQVGPPTREHVLEGIIASKDMDSVYFVGSSMDYGIPLRVNEVT